MRALCVLHDDVSSIGLIGDALSDRGWQVEEFLVVPADRQDSPNIEVSFPDSSDYDLLVVLGAPWAAYDDAGIGRWLTPELRWLSGTVAAGGAVLGICFGSQVLARALGGSVARSAHPEVGWVRIDSDVPALIPTGPWFQWHYDSFTLPPGAVELARNAAATQAYQVGRSMGVQFHPEVTTAGIKRWLDNGEATQAHPDVIDPTELLAESDRQAADARGRANALVAGYLDTVFPL
ncbi:type 1 glutamine amidotransferase [Rhodococcus opacus]|uniref:Aminotransferase n=1 Tax=Rhodococcus opacus TaxID=37919 RepID=A0A2S8II76_RHOOP|nr:type 1 glutamine amidotransferase [Rhodococcus opacus]PQP14476.1 aminotransferase [Rhodococcus opacus]